MAEKSIKNEAKFMETARKRCDQGLTNESENQEKAIEDVQFLEGGSQWPDDLKTDRKNAERPCLEINLLPEAHDQIEGDLRMNRPSIRVKPVDDKADPETAKIIQGLIRNIEYASKAKGAYNTASNQASAAGYGAVLVTTQYANEHNFDQEIRIKRVNNPNSIVWDPFAQEEDKQDAGYMFILEDIPREEYERRYPGFTPIDFDKAKDKTELKGWHSKDTVRVAQYWINDPERKKLYELADGSIVEEVPEGQPPLRERVVEKRRLYWHIIDGEKVIKGPKAWPGKYYPSVPVWGKTLYVKGKLKYRGIVRHAKDPQRIYNYWRSMSTELVALAPKIPWLLTPKMIGGHESLWKRAHKENLPYLLYNIDPNAPQVMPKREVPGTMPVGMANETAMARDEIRSTTQVHLPTLGAPSNETSGKAILVRQSRTAVGSYVYLDNLASGIEMVGRIIIDLIPHVYNKAQVVRIINPDDTERMVQINKPFQDPQTGKEILYDLTTGKYDVVSSTGPSYATRREEAAASMTDFLHQVPSLAPVIGDLVAKNMDWPGADEIAERLRQAAGIPQEGQEDQGRPVNPVDAAKAEQEALKVQQEEVKLAQEQEKLEGLNLENKRKAIEIAKMAEPKQ